MPNDTRNENTGRYIAKYADENIIEAIEELGGSAGTQEVAEMVECPYNTAYTKLRKLEESGQVRSRKVANARLWQVENPNYSEIVE